MNRHKQIVLKAGTRPPHKLAFITQEGDTSVYSCESVKATKKGVTHAVNPAGTKNHIPGYLRKAS